jgi:hypothetical protein
VNWIERGERKEKDSQRDLKNSLVGGSSLKSFFLNGFNMKLCNFYNVQQLNEAENIIQNDKQKKRKDKKIKSKSERECVQGVIKRFFFLF